MHVVLQSAQELPALETLPQSQHPPAQEDASLLPGSPQSMQIDPEMLPEDARNCSAPLVEEPH